MKRAAFAAALAVAACAGPPALAPPRPLPKLNPVEYFLGRSIGSGTLDTVFGKPKPVAVASFGHRASGGTFVLEQRIVEGDKAPRMRRWVLRRSGPSRWSGTLTDAVGPVAVTAVGNGAEIDYPAGKGVHIHQELRLQPDGRTLLNRLTAAKWGVPVAWVSETIRKRD